MFIKFSGYVGYDTRNNLKHFGDDRLNPLGHTGWMDIHEIFRIWTQEAIGYTVLRLSRLFHALQTRCGGGLRSRSASCSILQHVVLQLHPTARHYQGYSCHCISQMQQTTHNMKCNAHDIQWRSEDGQYFTLIVFVQRYCRPYLNTLAPRQNGHFPDDIFKCIYWIKMYEFRLKCHLSLFLCFELTIFHHWFR